MRQWTPYIFGLLLLTTSCGQNKNSPTTQTDKWYEETKQIIIANADSHPDSLVKAIWGKQSYQIISYKGGQQTKQKYYGGEDSVLCGETLFGKDTAFQLMREIYANGQYAYEGISYNGHFFGLSTWWNDNGQIRKQGIRFNDKKIGTWKEWGEDGKLVEEIDYKNLDKLDSLPTIHGQ